MAVSENNLIWIDLEMTGLDPQSDQIIEIATVVTDSELNELGEGPVLAIHQPDTVLAGMDESKVIKHPKLLRKSLIVLGLTMAGFIGTMGSELLSPIVVTSGIDLTTLPNWLVLIALVWIIPLAGQIGMNPILSVSLIAPLLPTAAAMGITPAALVTALTAGWALSGASSPFTATTMLVGNIARVSAWRVGLSWNGAYTVLSALTLSAWVAYVALQLDRLGT